MIVTLKLGEPIWRKVNRRELPIDIDLPALSVHKLLEEAGRRYPELAGELQFELGETDIYYSIFVNGHQIQWAASTETTLSDGDEVMLLLPLSGG